MMIEQYHHLLTQLSQDATGSLRTYSLVTPVMQQTILPDLRQPIPEPSYDLVPTVIADWAIQTPQQIALEQGHETWTYHEMVTFAQGVAQMLQTQSLSKGDVVAIWSGNCPQLIATILGTWLAGHPFLILDPKLPRQRWQVLLEASQASACILIGDTADKESDKDTEAVHMWLNEHCPTVLSIHESTQMPSAAMSESQCGPDDAAYIFFTSGTTGVPKGVRGTHKGLAHFLDWQRNTFAVQPTDRVAQLTSLSFDVVLRAIFLPLVSGATLVLPETSDIILSGEAVLPWLDAKKITITHIVPSLAKAWLANRDDTATLETMKLLFFAGEPLTSQLVTQWRNTFPHSGEIVNLYGPTETTLAKCFYRVPQDVLPGIQPVGRPQPDTHVVVMNQGRVCGVGEVGEIVIRTPFRTQGYINVKHTFSQNPFTDHSDDLLYYTGDAGRIRPNGLIDILGRLDRQVKIRGVRIELGEIENALLQHPHVKEAVVIIHENSEEDKRLVAYVVEKLKGGKVEGTDTNPSTLQLFNSSTLQPFNPSTLRQHLAQQLPDSMIPSAFVFLDAIPLTTNGKLDRRALPVPGYTEIQSEFVAPRTEMEAAVAAIWQSVLHVEQVGVNDSFFALGGHSLLATQVISQVRSQLNLDIPLKSLFEASQLGDFAQVVNQAISQTQQSTDERIVPVSREQPLPLSFSQQRLWFLDQLEPDSAFYNIPILLRLTGQLDVAVLEASFRYLIERHESLRTIFRTETSTQANAGESVQVIHPPSWASQFMLTVTPVVDEHQAYHLAHVEATTPFDLGEGPLLRVLLSSIADNDAALSLPKRHLLVLNMHHIISDVWSMGVLVKELTHAYRAYIAGQQPTLPDLPIQYADFAVWQRDYLSAGTAGARLETQRDYWRKQLADAPALLELPTDRPRPPVMSYRGAHYAFELSADLTAKLNQLAQTHDATLFMVLLTAFNILLSRYSRQDDIVVGSPIANRNRAEIEGLIGFFVNNLVLRTQLAGNPSFTELLAQVRQTTLDAYQHQDLPFEQLVDALDLERTLSYSPLFQVTLVLQNAEIGEFDLPNLTATMQPADFPFAKSDLRFILTEQGKAGNLWGLMEYATDLFDEATIARMMSHFTVLLESIVNEESLGVQQPIHQLPILTEDEVHQIVYEWNDTTVVFGEPQTIQALFEQQVARTPNAIALIFAEDSEMGRWGDGEMGRQGDRESVTITLSYHHTPTPSHPHTLTYAELNTRANQLAHHLIELGVQADTLVAVAMERSVEMVVSLLAVLKAGGAYVPIDPNYPEERIRYMLDDSAAPILLTQSHLPLAQFTEHGGVADSARQSMHVLAVDMMATALAVQPSHTPQTKTSTNDLAYVIYTSGSTGQPKGVMIEHGGAFNVAMTQAEVLPTLTTGSRLLQMASLSFDAATFEFMLALMHGVTLVVSSPHHERVGSALADLLQQQCITHVTLVPSVLQTLPQVDLPDLKVLITAGEACSPALVNQWGAGRTFFNLYGPTESPIWTTYALLQPNQPVHIGQPVPNRQVYILNDVGAIAPTGVAGELHIGGTQLARGYLNRPDLTVERFIDHPEFGRLYKTGDLCRWTASGAIEFLGRTDFQVKLRGFRIELGEIENALLAQDGVREAVVLAREEDSDKRLVAYLVGDGETGRQRDGETGRQEFQPSTFQPFNLSTLRSSLEQQLPDYMIPSAFVFLEAMPLTANGKLDRRALPAPEYVDTQIEFVAPHTETETVLATVWSELLGIEPIGIHHNFFELGGHSLLATQVASRIQAAFQISLPLRSIFEAPTLTDLASIVDSQHADAKLIQELRYGEINSDTHGATLGNDQPAEEKPAEEKLAEVTMVEGRL
ncbi:MAG: amino acid adenylation domain-containing protein [Chloroflexota bacterium]